MFHLKIIHCVSSKVKVFHWAMTTAVAQSWHDVITKIKQSHYSPGQDSRRLRLPDFKTIGTLR